MEWLFAAIFRWYPPLTSSTVKSGYSWRKRLHPQRLPHPDLARLRRHQIPQRIRRIVTADSLLVGIRLQNVFRPVRIVLHRRNAIQQPRAARMNEQRRANACIDIAEPLKNLRPAIHAVMFAHVSRMPSFAY
jgi:hypothetical protein